MTDIRYVFAEVSIYLKKYILLDLSVFFNFITFLCIFYVINGIIYNYNIIIEKNLKNVQCEMN